MSQEPMGSDQPSLHPMAPSIRLPLLGLYLALVLPLPLQAPPPWRPPLAVAVTAGLVLALALTSERVELDDHGIRVGHPAWCAGWLRRGWSLPWDRVRSLTPRATSQGGRVFYVQDGERAWLLPQRVARFEEFLRRFSEHTGLDTSAVRRITPPWTYRLLGVLALLMLAAEGLALVRATG
jgi:hypothetical protein